MERFVKGDVVVLPFPFSDLSSTKRRPALVLIPLQGKDVIVCPITSQRRNNNWNLDLEETDFESGSLKRASSLRLSHLFTTDISSIVYRVGNLSKFKLNEVFEALAKLFQDEVMQ
jgi:mRNA interferase MazF